MKPEQQISTHSTEPGHLWSRRDFFSLSGWVMLFFTLTGSCVAFLRFMFPRVLFEPSSLVKAGRPEDYSVGKISEKYKESHGVWIARTKDGFYAILAVCTHLGCTPRWLEAESKFKCPCHGSGFYRDGVNFEGPAPRALERLEIYLTDEGELLVDKSKKFLYEKDQWKDSVLRI